MKAIDIRIALFTIWMMVLMLFIVIDKARKDHQDIFDQLVEVKSEVPIAWDSHVDYNGTNIQMQIVYDPRTQQGYINKLKMWIVEDGWQEYPIKSIPLGLQTNTRLVPTRIEE